MGTKTFLASSNYTQAFRSAVSDSLTGIRPDQVTDIAVRTVGQPSPSRHLRDLSTPGASTTEISYAIGFIMEELGYTDPDAAFSTIKSQLQSSVEDSTFNELLQKFGFPSDVAASGPKFGSETVVLIRSAEPSPSPTSRIGRSSPAIFPGVAFNYSILIIVVGAVVVALIVALSRYYCLKACVSKDGVKDKERQYDSLADEDGKEEEEEEMGALSVLGASGDRVATEHPAEPSIEIHPGVSEEKRNNLSHRSAFSSFLKALSEGYDHLPPSSTADTPQPGPEEVDALSSDQVEVLVASDSKDREEEGQGDDAAAEQQSLLEMVSELLLPSPPSPTPSTDEQHPGRSEAEPSDEPIHTPASSPSLSDEKAGSPGKSKTGLGGLLKLVGRKLTGSKPTVIEKDPPHIVVDGDEESILHGMDGKDMASGDGEQKGGQASVPAPVAEQQSLLDMVSEMIASTIPDLPFDQTGEQPPQEVATDSMVAEQSTKVAAGSVAQETVNDDNDDNEDTELSSLPSQQASLLDLASELIAAMLPDGEEEAQDSPSGKQGDDAQSDQVVSPVVSKALSQKSLSTGTAEKRGGHLLTTSFTKPRSILKKPNTDKNSTGNIHLPSSHRFSILIQLLLHALRI